MNEPVETVDNTTDLAGAIVDQQYFQFTFTVDGLGVGETLNLDSFGYSVRRNSSTSDILSGWHSSQVAFRIDDTSFSASDAAGGVNSATIGVVDPYTITTGMPVGLINGVVVNFRVYGWGSDYEGTVAGGNNFQAGSRIGGIEIVGAVVPEPNSLALLVTACTAGLIARRSRRAR